MTSKCCWRPFFNAQFLIIYDFPAPPLTTVFVLRYSKSTMCPLKGAKLCEMQPAGKYIYCNAFFFWFGVN